MDARETPKVRVAGGDRMLLSDCRSVLQGAGHDVLLADDVAGRWRLFGQYDAGLDLLLVDVAMPDGTGPELVHGHEE